MIRKTAPTTLDVSSLHRTIDPIENYNERIFAAAQWYANHKIAIVPFMDYGYPQGMSQRHASFNIKNINQWWHPEEGRFPGAAIAMAHGGESGYCAVDLDVKAGVDGIATLAELQCAYGSYDDGEGLDLQTLMAFTPSGGRHLIFRYHPEIISNSEKHFDGIDTRGGYKKDPSINGGITFAEPSKKPKEEGFYRWDDSVTDIIDMPQWLVDVLNGRQPAKKTGIRLQESYIQSAAGDHGDGRDRNIYMDLMQFVGIGYTADQLWALLPDIVSRMDPPDEAMVAQKIESAINSDAFASSKEQEKTTQQVLGLDLPRDKKDKIIKSMQTLEAILTWPVFEHEYGLIQYDDFSHKFVKDSAPMESVANWAVGIQLWISRKLGLDFSANMLRETVEHIAYSERDHINTARDYMLGCPQPATPGQDDFWGSGRSGPGANFKRLCVEVLDLNNKTLHPEYTPEMRDAYMAFLWFWMQGVAARACVPGCKMEIVLNIFGSQGIGKSLFFRDLCPDSSWFTDSIQDSIAGSGQNNRDELMKLHAKIIVEMPELNTIKRGGKSGDNKMKQFISAQVDNFRRAYGHDSIDHPRTCALCGTSNDIDVYRDSSGSRRYVSINHSDISIRVGDQSNGVLKSIRNELWGEVVASFGPGELDSHPSSMLVAIPPPLRKFQNSINTSHKFEEIGIAEIVEWMQDKTRVTWSEVMTFAKSIPGLRDAKESIIISSVRKELLHDKVFKLKSSITICDREGKTKRVARAWVNNSLEIERAHVAGKPVPPHWSTYSEPIESPDY